MAVYRQDRRRRITLVMLIITSLVLITLDQQGTGVVATLRSTAQDVISPLQDVADSAISPVTDFFDSLGRGNELEAENERLRRQNAGLKSQIAANQSAVADAEGAQGACRPPRHRRLRQRVRQRRRRLHRQLRAHVPDRPGQRRRHREGHGRRRRRARWRPRRQGHVGLESRAPPCNASTTRSSASACSCSTRPDRSARRGFAQGTKDSAFLDLQLLRRLRSW